MRAALFVARRLVGRERVRTLAAAAVSAAVIFLLVAGLVTFNTIASSAEQKLAGNLSADLDVAVGLLPGHDAQTRSTTEFTERLLRDRYGATTRFDPSITALDVEATPDAALSAAVERATTVRYDEFDMRRLAPAIAYDLVAGRYPYAAGEVTLAPALAKRLRAGVGDKIRLALSQRPVTVVGIAQDREVHSTAQVLAAPGTWVRDVAGAPGVAGAPAVFRHLYVTVPAATRDLFERDFASGIDQAPYAGTLEDHSASISGSRAAPIHGFRAFWVKNTVAFTVPAVALLAAIVIGQCLLRLRRDLHVVGALQALGFTRRRTTTVLALGTLVPAVVGTVAGLLLGLAATLPWRAQIAALADTDPSTNPTPWSAIIVGILLFLALSAGGIAAVAARAAGEKALAAESSQFAERLVVRRSPAPVLGLAGVLVLVTAAWWFLKPADGNSGLIRAGLVCATLIAVIPALLVRLAHSIPPTRLTAWLAVRAARSEIARVTGIVAIAGFGLGAPLGLVMLQSSYTANAMATYHPLIPAGQAVVLMQHPLDADSRLALDNAAGMSAITQADPQTPHGDEVSASPDANGRPDGASQITVVSARREAEVDLGWHMPDRDWDVVARGQVLWLDTESAPAHHTVTFATYDDETARAHVIATAPAVMTSGTPPSTAFHWGGAVISSALATRLGLVQTPFWLRYPGAADRIDAITRAAALAGIASTDVRVDPGATIFPVPMSFKTALALGLLLVAIGIFLVVAPSGRESRAMNLTLHAVGLPPKYVRRVYLLTTLFPLLLGCLIGVVAGFGVFLADFLSSSARAMDIPWAQVGSATGAVLLVGLGAIAVSWKNLVT